MFFYTDRCTLFDSKDSHTHLPMWCICWVYLEYKWRVKASPHTSSLWVQDTPTLGMIASLGVGPASQAESDFSQKQNKTKNKTEVQEKEKEEEEEEEEEGKKERGRGRSERHRNWNRQNLTRVESSRNEGRKTRPDLHCVALRLKTKEEKGKNNTNEHDKEEDGTLVSWVKHRERRRKKRKEGHKRPGSKCGGKRKKKKE